MSTLYDWEEDFTHDEILKIMSLGEFLEIKLDEMHDKEIYFVNSKRTVINYDGKKYQVLDVDEEEEAFADELNHFIDETILSEIPENLQNYYDRKKHFMDLYIESERIGEEVTVEGNFYYVKEY